MKFLQLTALAILVALAPSSVARAASFSFTQISPLDGLYEVTLVLDAQGESINAVEGTVVLPPGIMLRSVKDGGSIMNFWVERPTLSGDRITFSGIVPGGYGADAGALFTLEFESSVRGVVRLALEEMTALRNDGEGTRARVTARNLELSVVPYSGDAVAAEADAVPPEPFSPLRSDDPNLFGGGHFIVFATQDKQSGVDYYGVAEERGFRRFSYDDLSFATASSPHLLADQTLASNLYVKAVDKKGNIRVAALSPANPPFFYRYEVWFAILIVLGALSYLWRRARHGIRSIISL